MYKRLIVIASLVSIVLSTPACTHKKVEGEEADVTAEADAATAADAGDAAGDVAALDDIDGASGVTDAPFDDGATKAPESNEAGQAADAMDKDLNKSGDEFADLDAGGSPPPAQDLMADNPPPEPTSPVTPPIDDLSGGMAPMDSAPKPMVSLKKINTTPYEKNGILVNAVYLARAGDTLEAVSLKIYGADQSKDLKKANPGIKKKLKVGDKVYYNSPKRPTDHEQMLTFYEDMGLAPETYVAKSGDNLRTVSKELLGDTNSWKEVWATNLDLESKGNLDEGVRIRYWAGTGIVPPAPTNELAQNTPPPAAAGSMDMGAPPADMAPPPPPPDLQEAAPPPPPPPSNFGAVEPPPPPPPMPPSPEPSATGLVGNDPDQTMALGAAAVLMFAAILLFVIIRKKRARRVMDFSTSTQTQID